MTLACTHLSELDIMLHPLAINSDTMQSLNERQDMDDAAVRAGFELYVWMDLSPESHGKTAIMSTHFLGRLQTAEYSSEAKQHFNGDKHLVIVPINASNHYSFAAVFVGADEEILLMLHVDSCSLHDSIVLMKPLWDILGRQPRVSYRAPCSPKQGNIHDCGAYMLLAVKLLLKEISATEEAFVDVLIDMAGSAHDGKLFKSSVAKAFEDGKIEHVAFLTRKWFNKRQADNVRKIIANKLLDLKRILPADSELF